MPTYPDPHEYFAYTVKVTKGSTAGTYVVAGASTNYGPTVVYDNIKNGANDSSTQLGDVANDQYTGYEPKSGLTDTPALYLGDTANGKSFVGQFYYAATKHTYLYLYTNNASYKKGQTVTINKAGVFQIICFAAGTRVHTVRGEVAVEDLAVGDLVITASGKARPIRWLGHRTIDCRRHPNPRETKPVRVRAHAFGENRPSRDLYLSPGHSVCVDFFGETLVPVGRLANGATIAQIDVDEVTYWHIELDDHDIVLAENLACETYIDCGTREFFAESEVVDLGALPDAKVFTTDDYCRPFHPEGRLVDFARERLSKRASDDLGWRLEVEDPLAGLWLEVDGQRVVPQCDGLVARITLPASIRDIVLCSDSSVPADIHGAVDERRLGLQFASAVADDGLHWRREMACTDERLEEGFHPHEGTLRWTDGRARLPAELWEGARDMFVLRLAFAGPALPRWIAPVEAAPATADSEVA